MSPLFSTDGLNMKESLVAAEVNFISEGTPSLACMTVCTFIPSFFLHPTEAMHGDLGMIGKDDIVLGISYSGESEELVQILPHLKR